MLESASSLASSLEGQMRSMSHTAIWIVLATAIARGGHAQNAPLFQFIEKPGPYAVGLKVVEQYDYSRTFGPATDDLGKPYTGERARPLQTLIWYPAEISSSKPMTVGDYLNLRATETSFGHPKTDASTKEWQDGLSPTLRMPLWAVRDATQKAGRFPVVIYAPSYSAMAWENADLCEYLASHGYVVIASPSMGATSRDMTSDVAGMNAQARDISFLIGYARTLPDTDISEIAVAGFSLGGLANLFAAARDSRIDALVALDGTMRYFPGLVKQSGDIHPEQMTIPLVFLAEGEITLEDQARYLSDKSLSDGPNVLNAWTHGDLVTVHMLGLIHEEFSSISQRDEEVWQAFPMQQKADYGREDGAAGYAWVARYTLQFLDAYLKHDAVAMAFLKATPAENGAPKHFMTASYRASTGPPPTLEGLRAALGRQGFDHATEIYSAIQKDNPDFKLDESAVDSWAHRLMDEQHLPEAIALLKLNAQNYPSSGNVYESLGDAYVKSNQKQLAIDSYGKSIEKNPDNPSAAQKLKDLENGATGVK
jgi:tetratricopeptide (TPR) repeat protein